MICEACGNAVKDDEVYCPYCGALVNRYTEPQKVVPKKKSNPLAIIGFVFALLGWIISAIWFISFGVDYAQGEGLEVAIILIVMLIYSFLLLIPPLIGMILSAIAVGRRRKNAGCMPLAIVGLILNVLLIVALIVFYIVMLLM